MAVWSPSILMFILAGGMAWYGVSQFRAGRRARQQGVESLSWPTTRGRVVASEVEHVAPHDGEGPGFYVPRVTYQYVVAGATFTGSRIAVRDVRGWKSTAAALVARYPVGGEMDVSYDPAEPQSCLLEPGSAGVGRTYFVAVVALFVALVTMAAGIVIPLLKLQS